MLGSFAGVADYGAFVIAIVVFLAIPGPGNLALITSTGKGGIAGGMGATFGVIAGDQSFGLGRFIAMFDEPNDGTVALRETELEGCADRLVLPVSHMGMLLSSRVADECAGFLSSGHFGLRS